MRTLVAVAAVLAVLGCTKKEGCLGGDDGKCRPPSPCTALSYACADNTLEVATMADATDRPPGTDARGTTGDVRLTNGRVTVIIDALSAPRHLSQTGGTIIDFVTHDAGTGDSLSQIAHVGGLLPEDGANYTGLEVIDESPNLVAVVVRGTFAGRDGAQIVTRYELRPCEPGVRIRTELYYGGRDRFTFFLADAYYWGDRTFTPFVPLEGQGFIHPTLSLLEIGEQFRTFPFMAGSTHGELPQAFAVVPCERKTLDGFQSGIVSAVGLPRRIYERGDSQAFERFVVAGGTPGLSAAVDLGLEAREQLFGEPSVIVGGRVIDGSGAPVGGNERLASVLFYEPGGPETRTPWSEVVPAADGTFQVRLPSGKVFVADPSVLGTTVADASVTFDTITNPAVPDIVVPATGVLDVSIIDGVSGTPLMGEIVLTPTAPTSLDDVRGDVYGFFDVEHCAPYLGPPFSESPACNRVLAQPDGTASFAVPPGTYWVYATKGPFYTLARQQVTITAGGTANLAFSLVDLTAQLVPAGVLGADFHVHSGASFDTSLPELDRARSFVASDVDVIAATDHDVVTSYEAAIATLGIGNEVVVMPGLETTGTVLFLRPPGSEFPKVIGHYNFWPLTHDTNLPRNGAPFDELVEPGALFERVATRYDGSGVAQLNHPYADSTFGRDQGYLSAVGYNLRTPVPPSDDGSAGGQLVRRPTGPSGASNIDHDVQEVMNGPELASWYNYRAVWFSFLSQGILKGGTANSDSHTMGSGILGYPRSLVFGGHTLATFDRDAFNDDVRKGRMVGTNGPVLLVSVDDAGGQAQAPSLIPFEPAAGAALQIEVRAAPWFPLDEIRVYVNGTLAETIKGGAITVPADPFGTADLVRYQGSIPLDQVLAGVPAGTDAWIVVETGLPELPIVDTNNDGLIDEDTFEEPPRPDETDPRFHLHVIVPGTWTGAFTNPLLVDRAGDGWTPPGLP